jgi:myo-inositol-1(or 4)-monophosphatase
MTPLLTRGFRDATAVAMEAVTSGLRLASSRRLDHEVVIKEGRDVVTTADFAVEATVRGLLADVLGMPSIGEEDEGQPPPDGAAYWMVDPICGTRNYASRTPLYCVNLALVEAGEVTIAVVGDPSTGEITVAERGVGAFAFVPDARRRLRANEDSLTIIVEDGKSIGRRRERAARFIERVILADRWDFRSLGTSLSLPYVASGRASAYVAFTLTSVHGAAGVLLAREAGATVTDVDGAPWTLDSDSLLVAATPELHRDLLALIDPDE